MSGIENYRFNLANVWNTMRAHQWLDRFCHISPRDQIFSVLLNQWEAQPTSRAIDHCLPAAAYKFQGVLDGIELAFLPCSGDAGGQSIQPGTIIDRSEERRVGKEGRSRRGPTDVKEKNEWQKEERRDDTI